MTDNSTTAAAAAPDAAGLRAAQTTVDRWIRSYGVRYFDALTNMAVLTEEVGEVARVIARTDGEQSAKGGERLDLADELADVVWVVCAIANQHGIDLGDAWLNNIAKKSVRDKERHRANSRLAPDNTTDNQTL